MSQNKTTQDTKIVTFPISSYSLFYKHGTIYSLNTIKTLNLFKV